MIPIEQLQSSIVALPIGEQEQLVAFAQRQISQHYARLEEQDLEWQRIMVQERYDRYLENPSRAMPWREALAEAFKP